MGQESAHPDFGTLSPRSLRPVHEIVLLICDVVADMARYVTGEIAAGKPSLLVRRFPLYHMEKLGGQNGTVFCNRKNIST